MVLGRTEQRLGSERTAGASASAIWRWNSKAIAPKERVSQWHDVHAVSIARRTITTQSLEFGEVAVDLARIGAGHGRIGLQRMRLAEASTATRDRVLLGDGNDDLILHVQFAGIRRLSQCRREAHAGPGGAIFSSNAERSTIRLTGPADFISIALPRAAIDSLIPDADDVVARCLPAGHPALCLLTAYLYAIDLESAVRDPGLGELISGHVLDLSVHAARGLRDTQPVRTSPGVAAARLAVIKADILANLSGDVSAGALAGRHGLSSRYLHKLFELEGTTLSRHVQALRLEWVHNHLAHPRSCGRTIIELINAAGFNDVSTFNRAFKARYGMTPREARHRPERW